MNLEWNNILKGWVNVALDSFGLLDEKTREKAHRRMEICIPCEFSDRWKCTACGCPLKAKIKSDSKCPENKW